MEALDDSPVRGIPVDDVIINRNIVENKNFNIVLVERSFIFSKEENKIPEEPELYDDYSNDEIFSPIITKIRNKLKSSNQSLINKL